MKCPGLHCPGCKDIPVGVLAVVGGVVAVVLVVLEFAAEILAVTGTMVLLLLAGLAGKLVRLHRQGELIQPLVAVHRPDAIRPVSEHPPVTARPVQALPAPQEFHLHLHGPLTPADIAPVETAELDAIREAAWRAFDTYHRREP